MGKLNNRGFTLVEVLAVIAIIAILGLIAIPSVLSAINSSRQASYDILVEDIIIASKQLYEEVNFVGVNSDLLHYDTNGKTANVIIIDTSTKKIEVNLQTLVSNGFLGGTNNPDKSGTNKNSKIITNPKSEEDIGDCNIIITKEVNSDYNTSYIIASNSSNSKCPTTEEYAKVS
ncbi:MAG: prepilin-type N-terminal cleavage/methylation domain-containing protein [Bacilli bacterium]|nr:prepilin-type N-terminal cleavage/methylation domain-containing protein [Bacilli bacterium]